MSALEPEHLTTYWLRTVRAGIQVTLIAVAILGVYPLIPGHETVRMPAYSLLLAVATAGAVVIWRLPWERLFRSGRGLRVMYAWSAVDIVLISVAVAVSHGGQSELFLLYGLTTVFLASYPPRGRIALFAFTVACYLTVLAFVGDGVGTADVLLRLEVLGTLALLTSFLSTALMRETASRSEAHERSELWAGFLSTVAASGGEMTLEPHTVVAVATEAVLNLGFDAAGVVSYDEETGVCRLLEAQNLTLGWADLSRGAGEGLPGMVRDLGDTVVLTPDDPSFEDAAPSLHRAGLQCLVLTPIWVDGWLDAALLAAAHDPAAGSPQAVEALRLLAAQAGLALENARRFRESLDALGRLEELDKLKNDFLTTASHEIRTPLTVILGSGVTLDRNWGTLDEDTRRQLVRAISSNAALLDGLIASLLDFSRVGADHHIGNEPCFVTELLDAVTNRVAPTFAERPLRVEVERDLVAAGDRGLIERVVESLLSNAQKHTPPGTTVRLVGRRFRDEVVVSVEDNGPGIPPDELQHLGERFFRGGEITARTKGLGLGLALAAEILDLHGTTLQVASEVGTGSRFAFALPSMDRAKAAPLAEAAGT